MPVLAGILKIMKERIQNVIFGISQIILPIKFFIKFIFDNGIDDI